MTVAGALALTGAGVVAGVVSTVVSLASVVSYPALLAAGLPPLSANVTNTLALTFTGIGSVFGSRAELTGQGRRVLRLGVLTALGGGSGAALLLLTPDRTFEFVAPVLIAVASVLLLVQRSISRAAAQDTGHEGSRLLRAGVFGTAIYTGYFGAAGGMIMLAVLAPLLRQPLARVNAVKNAVSGLANGVAALGFAVFGPVRWSAAFPLAAGFLLGGWLGPALVRRLPGQTFRILVGVCGLLVAGKLAFDTYR